MNKFINSIRANFSTVRIESFRRVAFTLLAVFFLSTTIVGCQSSNAAMLREKDAQQRSPEQFTELYKPISPPVGGMNNYSDVDPRMDTTQADAKAARAIDRASKLAKKDSTPIDEIRASLDKKGISERAGETVDRVVRSAEDTVEGLSEGTKEGFSNLQKNAESLADNVEYNFDHLGERAAAKASDIIGTANKTSP